jgi:signal transduction histidine kinase
VNLLVVDDIAQNIVAIDAVLARPGLNIMKASSGEAALELLLEHDFALALVDVQMPEMDGFELAELMRGSERTRHVPIIFVTAASHDSSRTFKGYESGAVDVLFKPIDTHILQSKVDVFVKLFEQKRQLESQMDALRESMRMNELFTAVVGHDLRTPLTAIITSAESIQRKAEDPEAVRRAASRIQSSSQRMARMIQQLLDLARVRAGQFELRRQDTDLVSVSTRILEEFQPLEAGRELRLDTRGDTSGQWDVDRLAQVLSNLVGNALRHGTRDVPVVVEMDGQSSARSVRLSVRNGGVIDPALLPELFMPFRTGQERGSGSSGLGLGLHICQQIVCDHGGTISVRSTVDEGTVFDVSLPRTASSPIA